MKNEDRAKIYAELHGDMQKFRIKSRDDNTLDAFNSMINNSNLAFAFDAFTVPDVELFNDAIDTSVGSVADEIRKAGEHIACTG